MKTVSIKRFLSFILVFGVGLFALNFFDTAHSANLSSVTVRLSTPRLSYYGDLTDSNTAGSSIVTVETSGAAPSKSVANLFEGDSIKIGQNNYSILNTNEPSQIELTTALQAGDHLGTSAVIATRSAIIRSDFTTVSAINGGSFRVLVPAATANYQNGIPDTTGWDFTDNTTNITLTCPTDAGGHNFTSGTKSPGAVTVGSTLYHSFTCPYTGVGSVGQPFTILVDGLINPAPSTNPTHTEGTADQYRILVQHLDGGSSVLDQTSAAVALIESVKVTASVAPQITFTIGAVNSATSVCGITTSVTTTATLVPLGELAVGSFRHAAQSLTVSTNATEGYVVTAMAQDQLARPTVVCTGDGDTTPGCIPDSPGDGAGMNDTDADEWTLTATKGFGYTLAESSLGALASAAFEYDVNSSGGACGTNTDCYRQFADEQDGGNPITLFSSTSVADNDSVHVCYKAVISTIQEAATDYETNVTYRATATF